jgi:hypothetical protein
MEELFPPYAWMKLTLCISGSCDYTKSTSIQPWFTNDQIFWHDRNGVAHPIMSNEAVARVLRHLGCVLSFAAGYDEQGRFSFAFSFALQ